MKSWPIAVILLLMALGSAGCLQAEKPMEARPSKAATLRVPGENASVQSPFQATADSLAEGKRTYNIYCKTCHGESGKGGEMVTQRFEYLPADLTRPVVAGRTDGELFWLISKGVNGTEMLPWEDLLGEERRWDLVNYIRTLQAK